METRPESLSRSHSATSATRLLAATKNHEAYPPETSGKLNAWARRMHSDLFELKRYSDRSPFRNDDGESLKSLLEKGVTQARGIPGALENLVCAPYGKTQESIVDLVIRKKVFSCLFLLSENLEHRLLKDQKTVVGKLYLQQFKEKKSSGLAVCDFYFFEGEMKRGIPNGKGRLHYSLLSVFEGFFDQGQLDGCGIEYHGVSVLDSRLLSMTDQTWYKGRKINEKRHMIPQVQTPSKSFWGELTSFFGIESKSFRDKSKNQ